MSIPILTKNQFKEASRYLQEALSKKFEQKVPLSTVQEALSIAQGFKDLHGYQNWMESFQKIPPKAKYANGDIAIEIQSLRFCLEAAQGGFGTAYKIRSILLHMYNNKWNTKLDLKSFDETHAIHMLNVIALDSRPFKEIHNWIDGSHALFQQWAEDANNSLHSSYRTFREFALYWIHANLKSDDAEWFLRDWHNQSYEFYGELVEKEDKELLEIFDRYF